MENDRIMRQNNGEWLGKMYLEMAIKALNIIKKYFGEDYIFPIDIETIARNVGIEIIYSPLNGENVSRPDVPYHRVVGKTILYKNIITQERVISVLVDDESSQAEQHYAIAHELARFILRTEEQYSSEYHLMTILDTEEDEIEIELLANLLMLPLPLVIKEYYEYIGNWPIPKQTSEWLQYLSYCAQVPYENVVTGYQNIRYAACAAHTYMEKNVPDCEWPGFENAEPINQIKKQLSFKKK